MQHTLDNPIWNGLKTGNQSMKLELGGVVYFEKDVAPFFGLEKYNDAKLIDLAKVLAVGQTGVVFSKEELNIPYKVLELVEFLEIYQMVYQSKEKPNLGNTEIRDLGSKDVAQMLDLTAKTKPGPFLNRTIEFGGYRGIFAGKKLVSMAGFRLNPMPFVEISAVCTDPDYLGRGYASALLNDRISTILEMGQTPFLHVATNNKHAIKRYKALGFTTRTKFQVYILNRKD